MQEHSFRNLRKQAVGQLLNQLLAVPNLGSVDLGSLKDSIRVLVCRPVPSLGNMLGLTPLITEINRTFPKAKIDIAVSSSVSESIYKNLPGVDSIFTFPIKGLRHPVKIMRSYFSLRQSRYDLVINPVNSNSGRILAKLAHGDHYLIALDDLLLDKQEHFAKSQVCFFRNALQCCTADNDASIPNLELALDEDERDNGKKILNVLMAGDEPKRTISMFTNATGDKCYSASWWRRLYDLLMDKVGDVNFIEILPIHGEAKLSGLMPGYHSQDIREVAALIAATDLFIGADSGIMHLASAAGTPTVGLFNVTPIEVWRPYGTVDMAIDTKCGSEEWVAHQIVEHFSKL